MDTNCGSRGTESVNSKVLAPTLHAEPAEEAIRHAPIRRNLLPQRIDVGELALIPDALHESQPNGATVQVARVIEQVRFDRQLLLAKRRTYADVGNARVHNSVNGRRRCVDTVRRNELVVRLQVGGRETNLAATFAPRDHRAVHEVWMTEESASLVDATFRDKPPDACAAHHEILVA